MSHKQADAVPTWKDDLQPCAAPEGILEVLQRHKVTKLSRVEAHWLMVGSSDPLRMSTILDEAGIAIEPGEDLVR